MAGAVGLTVIAMRQVPGRGSSRIPVLGEVPEFTLVDTEGRPFGSRELAGRTYVANFFFTRCPSICPVHMQSAKALAALVSERAAGAVTLLSITVDPENDTPEVLREYGRKLGVAEPAWKLLGGERSAIVGFAEGGLKVPVGEAPASGASVMDIAHTGRFVLVDGRGRIRGYYERSESRGMEELFEDARSIAAERAPAKGTSEGG
ncbi:MAG: SCO family protein [Deltaproteobacteria bacterium]|nr:SCO family protein [Deltaproteobacteria bacterium]